MTRGGREAEEKVRLGVKKKKEEGKSRLDVESQSQQTC